MRRSETSFEIPFGLLRLFCAGVLKLGFALEIRGIEHVKAVRGSVILSGNHTGFLDSGILLAACDHYFRFVMKEEVLSWGLVGKVVPHANVVVLSKANERRTLARLVRELKRGERICIFPEGKLTLDGCLNEFQEGVAFLHQKSGAPIIPFAISGGFEAWPHWRRWPRFRKVVLQFDSPLVFAPDTDRARITRVLKEKVARMKQELDELEVRLHCA